MGPTYDEILGQVETLHRMVLDYDPPAVIPVIQVPEVNPPEVAEVAEVAEVTQVNPPPVTQVNPPEVNPPPVTQVNPPEVGEPSPSYEELEAEIRFLRTFQTSHYSSLAGNLVIKTKQGVRVWIDVRTASLRELRELDEDDEIIYLIRECQEQRYKDRDH